MRVVVTVEAAYVSPVALIAIGLTRYDIRCEVIDLRQAFGGKHRDDICSHVMNRRGISRINSQSFQEHIR